MFKKYPKMETPEGMHKTLKRKAMINWIIFFVVLALVTIGILELLQLSSQ